MFPLSIHIYFEIGALLVSLIFWNKIKNTSLRLLPLFLLFVVGAEMYGRYLSVVLHRPNAWLYNFTVPIEYLFYALLFYMHYTKRSYRTICLYFLFLFPVFVLINILFIQGSYKFNSNILKVGTFSMILLCCFYFAELFQQEKQVHLLKEPMFWVATGVFLFNTGEFFYSLFADYLREHHLDRPRKIFKSINNKLNWILYTCLAIAILCTQKKPRKT